ncbi:hypothetical protein [Flavobacterium sp.]|uniref:hypothetical protein n=1 Tax=Flavobacterium sp. TaxID=239 RepID=UPI00262A04E5|nr:hypothetical protein [Flavobacterium sp.]
MKIKIQALLLLLGIISFSCTDNDDTQPIEPQLIIKFKFDPTQARLNNIGEPSTVPAGNAAQSPIFNSISSHYIELAPSATTALGAGKVLYRAAETTVGGENAIDFSKAKIVGEGEAFLSIPLSQITAGSYEWVRCSLAYQNYNINILNSGVDYTGTLASFVGFNTYITTHSIGSASFPVNANKKQGYWALNVNEIPFSGQAPEGATTVPNPLFATSTIPAGSCVVTGKFAENLVITGNETNNIVMTLSLSINNSFEWTEVNADGKYEPNAGENVVDMGLRGLIPTFVK